MRIENSDIDCLIDISVLLKKLASHPTMCFYRHPYSVWHERVRKVYILLLNASEKGQMGIKDLVEKGVKDDSPVANAVRVLCPKSLKSEKF